VSNPSSPGPYWQEPAGEGPYRDELNSRRAGNGRRSGDRRPSTGNGANGYADPGGAPYGRPRPGPARASGSQTEADLRARLGLGNGAPDSAGPRTGNPARGRYATPPGGPDGQGRPYDRGPRSGGVPRGNGGRPSGNGQRGRRASGSQTEADLRARLGLGDGAPAPQAPPRPSNGYGGAYGYDAGNGFGGHDVSGYAAPGGRRGATALRERGATDFIDSRTSPRRARGYSDGGGSGGRRGGGSGTRTKGSWWRHWSWRKALAVSAASCAVMMLLIVAAIVYLYAKTQVPTDVSFAAVQQSSTVYYSNGKTEVGTFTADGIDRQMLTSSQIPPVMDNAIIAAEDRHFYTEGGISISGILRSAYEDLKGGGNLQGGSTLTEEFVKNYYTTVGTSRTVGTKLKEIFISIKLSHQESKGWILTQYLNTVSFGDNAYGIGAAAQIYFGEPALKLTISQSAMLAAMVNQPSNFSPNPKAGQAYQALFSRWQYVLTNMVRDGAITQAQANAQKFPTVVQGEGLANSWTGYRGYIMQAVENELENTYHYTQNEIDTGGLKIVTTFNLKLMKGLYAAVDQNLAQMKDDGQGLPSYAHVGALLEQPGTGDILAEYGGPSFSASDCTKIDCDYNMATESRNLVGSSFKPYVLAAAVKQGMNVQDSVLNAIEPMCVPPDSPAFQRTFSTETTNCPPGWFPVDIPGENMGPVSVVTAAAQSSDPAFEDLVHRVGTQNTINMAKAFGVNTAPVSQGGSGLQLKVGQVGMALGTASLTVEEQATTFATLAADGEYATPHVINQITQNGNNIPLKITHRQVLTPAQAADVDYALSFDTINGTAEDQGQLSPVRPVIGKTGTTDQAQSAFFLGAIPQYSLAVGMFTNSQNELPGGETLNILPTLVGNQTGGYGGAWPTAIWRTFMNNEFSTLPIDQLPMPDYVGFTKWNQVPPQPKKKPKPQHPNPTGNQCPAGQHRLFGVCVPGGANPNPNPNPNPTPTNPNPTPSPTASTPPIQGGTETAAAVLLAEDPTTAAARLPGGG
jgi:membrane peptidoglycan carboxypeptidase